MQDFQVWIEPQRMEAWGRAVGAQFYAQEVSTTEAWAEAARAWDALAKLYTPAEGDRLIFLGLAKAAWFHVLGRPS